MMYLVVRILVCASLAACGCGLYTDTSPPWEQGPLTYNVAYPGDDLNPAPLYTKVFYPENAEVETYVPVIHISGFFGLFPGEFYDQILDKVAMKGYVAIAPWPFDDASVETLVETIIWLATYWEQYVPVPVSWEHLYLSCHSSGCENIAYLLYNFPFDGQWNGVLNLEPSSFFINDDLPRNVPGLNLGTELADGYCTLNYTNYRQFHYHWGCPKVMMEVAEFGHCDLLTDSMWLSCESIGFCPVGPQERIEEYRTFIAGLMVSHMNVYAQGSTNYTKYFTEREHIPMRLNVLEYEETC